MPDVLISRRAVVFAMSIAVLPTSSALTSTLLPPLETALGRSLIDLRVLATHIGCADMFDTRGQFRLSEPARAGIGRMFDPNINMASISLVGPHDKQIVQMICTHGVSVADGTILTVSRNGEKFTVAKMVANAADYADCLSSATWGVFTPDPGGIPLHSLVLSHCRTASIPRAV